MNPEIDKIASAAIDGEATAEELTRLDNDPGFIAAKTELAVAANAVARAPLPQAPPDLARSQISVAMDHFKAEAAQRALLAAQPSETNRTAAANAASKSKRRFELPGWFAPAFLSVAVLGGLGIAANNFGSSSADDASSETTAANFAQQNSAAAESADSGAMDDSATPEALEEDAALQAPLATTTTRTDAEDGADRELLSPDPIDLSGATFVAGPTVQADQAAKLATRTPPLDPTLYERCGLQHGYDAPPGDLELVVPFSYDSEPAEVLVYDTGEPGGRTALILDESCKVLSQS
jgi:hypothetical protein